MDEKYIRYPKAAMKLEWINDKCDVCSGCVVTCSMLHFKEAHREKAGIRLDLNYNDGIYKAYYCRQCDAPSCVQACRVGAMYIDETTGCRVIDQTKCIGCKQCMKACPFDAVIYVSETKTCFKCDLCGGDPQCVVQCPPRALLVQPTKPNKK